jgi:hypothetical protein
MWQDRIIACTPLYDPKFPDKRQVSELLIDVVHTCIKVVHTRTTVAYVMKRLLIDMSNFLHGHEQLIIAMQNWLCIESCP